jgi:hypothetical protein
MVPRSSFRLPAFLLTATLCCLFPLLGGAQMAEEKERPNQLDIFKVNVTQIAVNELRVLYETQLRKASSLEFGASYIYANPFWFDRGGTQTLASGWGLYASYRKYFDRKAYIFQPKFRNYLAVQGFARFTHYDKEWLRFGSGIDLNNVLCEQISARIQQYGLVLRFGSQTNVGRVVVDFYAGLGVKYLPQQLTSHAVNDSTDVCGPIPATKYRELRENTSAWGVALHGGMQLGIRRNNRVRKSPAKQEKPADPDYPESPPHF